MVTGIDLCIAVFALYAALLRLNCHPSARMGRMESLFALLPRRSTWMCPAYRTYAGIIRRQGLAARRLLISILQEALAGSGHS